MEKLFKLLILAGIIGFGICSVQVRSGCIGLEREIGKARLQKKALLNEQKILMAEREQLLSLQRVRYLASNKFGLQEPDRKKVVFVVEGFANNGPMNVRYVEGSEGGIE